jgi:hypothetical protein
MTNKEDDNDSLYLSDTDDETYTPSSSSSGNRSLYEIDIMNVDPSLIRIFNITPPIEQNPQIHPDTMIPYFIMIRSPSPHTNNTLAVVQGKVKYCDWIDKMEKETLKILIWWANQMDSRLFEYSPPHSFDDIYNTYYTEKYTRSSPFSIQYFMDDEWQTFKYTSIQKDKLFSMFHTNFHKFYVL